MIEWQEEYKRDLISQTAMLLGWDSDTSLSKSNILDFIVSVIMVEVGSYCHLAILPQALKPILSMMIVDVYRHSDFGKEFVTKDPTSIKRGDVTISYKLPFERSNDTLRNTAYIAKNSAFMKDYFMQLNSFRQVKW